MEHVLCTCSMQCHPYRREREIIYSTLDYQGHCMEHVLCTCSMQCHPYRRERERLFTARWTTKDFAWTCTMHIVHASTSIQEREREYLQHAGLTRTLHGHVLCTLYMHRHPYRREREIIYSTLDYQGLCMDMYYAHCTCIDIHTGERERLFTARWTTKDFAWTCTMHIVHASTSIQEREREYLQHAGLTRTLHGTCTMHMFHAMSSIQERERESIYSTLDYQGHCMDMYYAHCTCIDIHTGERERVFTARWTNKDIAWNMYYAHVPCNVIHTGERERLFTARWTTKDFAWTCTMHIVHASTSIQEREREYLQHAGLTRTLHGTCTMHMFHAMSSIQERERDYLQHAGLSRTLHGTCTMHMFHAMSSIQERERESIYSTLDYQGHCMDMYYAHCTCIDIHTGERERVFTARWTNKDIAWTCTMHIVHASTSIQERERDYLQHAGLPRTLHGHVLCTLYMHRHPYRREREIIYSTLD